MPTGLKGVASSGRTVTLTWNASTDDTGGAVVYQIYRDGGKLGSNQTGLTYVDHPAKTVNHTYLRQGDRHVRQHQRRIEQGDSQAVQLAVA